MQGADPLDLLRDGQYTDPDSGEALHLGIRDLRIEASLDGMEAELVAGLGLGERFAVVHDPLTYPIMGKRVVDALASLGRVREISLGARPHADMATADLVRNAARGNDTLVAVGSGTINDLCKYAAAALGVPYLVFATAPSMNGYLSANAAITQQGHKKSLPAAIPAAAFFDLHVLSQAPPRMIRSGLGDSLCRPTAQSDWLLARLLLDQPYRDLPFQLLARDEDALLAEPQALLHGDLDAMRRLVRTLVLSGIGMTLCGSSYPASQGEHLISHYIDMRSPAGRGQYFHGEQVGVTTLTMAALQRRMLAGPAPEISAGSATKASLVAHFGHETGVECWEEFSRKRIRPQQVDEFNHRLSTRWDEVRGAIDAVARPPGFLQQVLETAGAPCSPAAIGVAASFYRDALLHARELRDRYTFLDLAGDAGVLGDFADRWIAA